MTCNDSHVIGVVVSKGCLDGNRGVRSSIYCTESLYHLD